MSENISKTFVFLCVLKVANFKLLHRGNSASQRYSDPEVVMLGNVDIVSWGANGVSSRSIGNLF